MKHMNDFLLGKFREQEDIRNSVRDTHTYIKLHMPVVTQMQINDQVLNLLKVINAGVVGGGGGVGSGRGSSMGGLGLMDEEKLLSYQGLKLESLLQNISLEKGRAEKVNESDLLSRAANHP